MRYLGSGRPPGVPMSNNRRRRTTMTSGQPLLEQGGDWELRDDDRAYDDEGRRRSSGQQYLVQEVDESEEEEGVEVYDIHGMRDFFANGRDRTPTTRQRGVYDEQGVLGDDFYYDSDEQEEEQQQQQQQQRFSPREREREEALVQSAYARIARAREKGKTNVNLTQEEMQALERGRQFEGRQFEGRQAEGRQFEGRQFEGRRSSGQQQVFERRSIQQLPEPMILASTPPPPIAISNKTKEKVKAGGGGGGSRSSSAASLASLKRSSTSAGRKSGVASPAKSNSKAKVTRKSDPTAGLLEQSMVGEPLPMSSVPPGMRLVTGPNGVPMFVPYDYYPARVSPSVSRTRSSSSGQQRGGREGRRDSATPPREYPPTSMSTRYRPGSSSSLRDDGGEVGGYDWYGPSHGGLGAGRQRSVSNLNGRGYAGMPYAGYEYGGGAERPGSRSQELYEGGVRYPSSLRRNPPPPTMIPVSAAAQGRERDLRRVVTGGSEGSSRSGSEGSEEQGVRVEVSAVEGGGYDVRRRDVEEEDDVLLPVVEERKSKSKGKDLSGKYSTGSVRKRKGKR